MKKNLLLLLVLICGCSSPKAKDEKTTSLTDDLIGEWQNTYIKVTMNSFNGITDSVRIMEADTSNWENVIKMKPISTFFDADGTYHSDHYSLGDTLLFSARGAWYAVDDTLVLDQTTPNVGIYRFKTVISNGEAIFSAIVDFDEDGMIDDTYFGKQQKQ